MCDRRVSCSLLPDCISFSRKLHNLRISQTTPQCGTVQASFDLSVCDIRVSYFLLPFGSLTIERQDHLNITLGYN